ncbi:histidine phosphatase family protein [Paraburkholderia sabiae]|uniref:Histidine phosphatase family protein n=1 Tax=Paraburkholderia sabiae TaxID=273251 RepID=A0ABU9QHK3_9BURK|nr:histidine phosphatase family protein [Paraburkholderia sabiae]WJZ76582.1 histidine phosphatase family protein [Paraburkholderia sabiae]CAD6552815.1 Adenosylcobalamin/alpha-ribazole phosphatase [Paraburkholderia sabiae]
MRTRLLLISHPATAAQRKGAFPADDPLDAHAIEEAAAFRVANADRLNADLALSSPAPCARETAHALGFAAHAEPALADADYGRWRGRRLLELADEEPDALATWTRDPSAAPHGGESFDALKLRVGGWLDAFEQRGNVIAVTHASVIRAALMHILQTPPATFARIEVPPLAIVELRHNERGWTWWPAPHRHTGLTTTDTTAPAAD